MINLLQADVSTLTDGQWTLLSNLLHIFDESPMMARSKDIITMNISTVPIAAEYQKHVQLFSASAYEAAGTYLRLNADIGRLPFDERAVILRSAADNVTCLGAAYAINHMHLFDLQPFYKQVETIYGVSAITLYIWANRLIYSDLTEFKLALALFAVSENTNSFSSHASARFTGSLACFRLQNQYAELTWKYLTYKYGWRDAVTRFTKIASWLTAFTLFMFHASTIGLHVNDLDALVEQAELTLILDETANAVCS